MKLVAKKILTSKKGGHMAGLSATQFKKISYGAYQRRNHKTRISIN